MSIKDADRRAKLLRAIKPQVDDANLSTVCEKTELNVPLTGIKLNLPRAACFFVEQMAKRLLPRRLAGSVGPTQSDVVTN
jgi:hypothetical protein